MNHGMKNVARRAAAIACASACFAAARADEPPPRVRASATVTVIDDAHNVNDIIAQLKARPKPEVNKTSPTPDHALHPAPGGAPDHAPNGAPARDDSHKIERPALPPLPAHEDHGAHGDRVEKATIRADHRLERERHRDAAAARHHR